MAKANGGSGNAGAARGAAPKRERVLVMAGTSKDEEGKFVGYDGERSRFTGQKFYVYTKPLPSWCRVRDKDGKWVDVKSLDKKVGKPEREPAIRRAHPSTPAGQAPSKRLRELEDDELELSDELSGFKRTSPAAEGDDSGGGAGGGEGGEGGDGGRASDSEVG
jgi:hypothetical protein